MLPPGAQTTTAFYGQHPGKPHADFFSADRVGRGPLAPRGFAAPLAAPSRVLPAAPAPPASRPARELRTPLTGICAAPTAVRHGADPGFAPTAAGPPATGLSSRRRA